jgi:hypothetical protein
MVMRMTTQTSRPSGNCPCCHRLDISHRVVIGDFQRLACRMCADGYKRTPGVEIHELTARQIKKATAVAR